MHTGLNAKLAEVVGILLGDGSFYISGYNNELDVALNTRDINYKNYVKNLLKTVSQTYVREKYVKNINCVHIRISRKAPVDRLLKISFGKQGNKIKNKVTIPKWIWKKDKFITSCIRGLIDTDGSIYRLKPHWPNLFQISFKSNDKKLLIDTRKAFLRLGFHPSKVFGNRIVITRQKEVKEYFDKIGTNNDRNLEMHNDFLSIYKP